MSRDKVTQNEENLNELHGKGSLDRIKKYHKDASAVSTDSSDAREYHDTSVRRSEILATREKARKSIKVAKKGSTLEKGWRKFLDAKDSSERQRKYSQKERSRLSPVEKRIHNTYLKAKGVNEDAPTNNVGGGGIAGVGVGPQGEPGVPRKRRPKEQSTPTNVILGMLRRKAPSQLAEDLETFAGSVVFEVSSQVFHLARNEKRRGKHWRKYLDEDDCFAEIREYAHKNPGRGIVLRNVATNEMCYARYPKKR